MHATLTTRAAATAACVLALVAGNARVRDTGHLLRATDVVEEMRSDGAVADVERRVGLAQLQDDRLLEPGMIPPGTPPRARP